MQKLNEITKSISIKINYITGIDGLTAVFIEETGQTDKMYYVAKDHLGSITHLINSDGTLAAEYSYDPCSVKHGFCECSETKAIVERTPNGEALREGRRRKSSDWLDYAVTPFSIINRGYTGHEHLEFFGLINMNGRIYDPISARFTTPDPFLQDPGFSQDFNRYSYVNNNPMRYSDPSGYMAQGCGHNPYWVDMAQKVEQQKAAWNNTLDGLYERSIYNNGSLRFGGNLGGGPGGVTTFLSVGGKLFSVADNGTIITTNAKDQGTTSVIKRNGNYGFYSQVSGTLAIRTENGYGIPSSLAISTVLCVWVPIGSQVPKWNDVGWERPFADYGKGNSIDGDFDGVLTIGVVGNASAGFIGAGFELGFTIDLRDGLSFGVYGSLKHSVGADLSIGGGVNFHEPVEGKNINISDLDGWSETYNYGFLLGDYVNGGNSLNSGLNPDNYSDYYTLYNTYGYGISVGSPLGFTRSKGYTWTTPTLKLW